MRPHSAIEIVAPAGDRPLHAMWKVKDVCRFLGVSKRWVHERTRRHEIPSYRCGTVLRFDPEEIRAWWAKFHHPPEEVTRHAEAPGRR